ncbi:MAG: cupin domain-containing protein [Deltaproteobacteria bacterium]|nr:cupin domain-containing protein [Deltaproteobacteria bacterium]
MEYYHQWEDFPEREISYLKGRPESSKLLVRILSSERMMVTNINAKKGAFVPLHHHEAEQIILVLKGKMKATTGKESSKILGPGSIWVVPSNHPHSVTYIEDTKGIEVVSPPRLDNFVGYTISHTFFDE